MHSEQWGLVRMDHGSTTICYTPKIYEQNGNMKIINQ